jgi:hypothetical protein
VLRVLLPAQLFRWRVLLLTPRGIAEKVQAAGRSTRSTAASRQAKLLLRVAALGVGACVALAGAAGCGEAEGVADGATVTAYVEAPLCASAEQELQSQDGRAGGLRVKAVCLPSPHGAKKLSLATVGANARRATEDSTAVAYLEVQDPRVSPFTHRILETAELPWIAGSGSVAMSRLLKLIDAADSGPLRQQLREDLNQA